MPKKNSERYVVKSANEEVWSGTEQGDPENPSLGRMCVFSVEKAHRFDDLGEAQAEAATYIRGALVLRYL